MFPGFLLAAALLTPTSLTPSGYVNDFAHILQPETVVSLNQELTAFTATTSAEVSVVTIPSLGNDQTIETYATELFEKWGIGKEKEDNGVLLLISRDDREMRIEVGYGLEPVITDIESAHIISDIIAPAFQAGDYDRGVVRAVQRIESDIARGSAPVEEEKAHFPWGDLIYLVILLLFIFLNTRKGRRRRGFFPPIFFDRNGGSGGGGFGGGSSGGGGASGRW